MAKSEWRCSQCGTVNEPEARACRECGKWPSLFDLQDPAATEAGQEDLVPTELEPRRVEPEPFEPDTFTPEDEPPDDAPQPRTRGKLLRSLVVPVALLV
jgi:hypothetical protein